ncbi:MAG: hypothetical protein JWQ48_267 [Conexibacter sp.]|nr:hypothetical protein [Conexibacter sp.]
MLRYADWRGVIAESPLRGSLSPSTSWRPRRSAMPRSGRRSPHSVKWVRDPDSDLEEQLRRAYALLASGFAERSRRGAAR